MFYKLIKKPFFGDFMVKWRNPLSEEQKKEWTPISTKSKSGSIIQGLFAKATSTTTKATIVLGHPMGKEAKGYFLKRGYTKLLRENGFNTVVFDINGFGESPHGNFSFFEDITAMSIKAKSLSPNLPIGYHGISLGAMYSTVSFADKNHQFNFAIVESAATSLADFWIHFPFAYKVLKTMSFILPSYKRKIEFQDRIKETKHLQSVLFIYSESDTWVPLKMGKILEQNTPVPTQFWQAKEAQHAEIMKSSDKTAYETRILTYFNEQVKQIKVHK